jgi:hypothetical protein
MKRFLFSVALLAIWTNVGFAQTKEIQEELNKKLNDLRTEDELLRLALASHPDVMVAQAKRQVAEAELAQVKLAVAQKLSKLKSELVWEEQSLRASSAALNRLLDMRKKGGVSEQEVIEAEMKVQFAQAKLSQLKTQLKEGMPNANNTTAHHPDILVARSKLQVADAELAQTKLVLAQKIATLKAEIEAQKHKLTIYESAYNESLKSYQAGTTPKVELMPVQIRFLESRSVLTRLNSELKGMTNLTQSQAVQEFPITPQTARSTAIDIPFQVEYSHRSSVVKTTPGSPADMLKAVLDKKVKFEAKAQPAADVIKSLKEKYGLDVMIRMPLLEKDGGFPLERITLSVSPGDMTFTTWIELIVDDLNAKMNQEDMKFVVTVREYGLLITPEKLVPQDAVTLKEFARQVRAEKERVKEKEKASTEPLKP